jgi:hypothetical protein
VNVGDWRELLGHDVLLLAWPTRSKGTPRKWGHLTIAEMAKPDHLAKLERGNIGVVLGAKSGNLVALDADTEELVELILAVNPFLADTLQTRGNRGRVFWLRMAGDYPAKTVKLKTKTSGDAGEWRAGTNTQSIIHGIHPDTGKPYQVLNKVKPLMVVFSSIVWPKKIANPPELGNQINFTATEDTEDTEDTKDTDETNEVLATGRSILSVEDVLRLATPIAPHQNYHLAMVMGRGVKALEARAGKLFTPEQHRKLHNQWLKLAAQFLRPDQTKDDYFMEYLNAYKLAKFPLGQVALTEALKIAKKKPIPPAALEWTENPDVRLLAALCRELQIIHGKEPFFLSGRMVQKIFKHETHATGAKWLRSFCVMDVLDEVKKGSGISASRYRWKLQPQSERAVS